MSYMTTVTRTEAGIEYLVAEAKWVTAKAAESDVNNSVEFYLNHGGATGGRMGDWRNVRLYLGSTESVVEIKTVKV